MAAITENKEKQVQKNLENQALTRAFNVDTNIKIPLGAIVGIDGSGNAVNAVTTTQIVGIAINEVDNLNNPITTDLPLQVKFNHIETLPNPSGFAIEDTAFVTDNQTLQTGSVAAILGRVSKIIDSNLIEIYCTLRA